MLWILSSNLLIYSPALSIPSPLLDPIRTGTLVKFPSARRAVGSAGTMLGNMEKLSMLGLELNVPGKTFK